MQRKVISIPSNENLIYRQVLASLDFMLKLTPSERGVLSEVIRLNNKYEVLPIEDRVKFIFCTETRLEMCERLGLKKQQLYNLLGKLKQKSISGQPLIDENNILHPFFCFKSDEEGFRIEINLINSKLEPTIKEVNKEIIKEEKEIETREDQEEEIERPREFKLNIPQDPDITEEEKIDLNEITLTEPKE